MLDVDVTREQFDDDAHTASHSVMMMTTQRDHFIMHTAFNTIRRNTQPQHSRRRHTGLGAFFF